MRRGCSWWNGDLTPLKSNMKNQYETKSGWTRKYLLRRLEEEQAKLVECENSSHPFRSAMVRGQRERIASIQRHLNQ